MTGTKQEKVMVRVTPEEKEKWLAFSKDQNVSLSDIVRILVRKAIHKPSILYESQESDPSIILKEFKEVKQQINSQLEFHQKQNALLLRTLNSMVVNSEEEDIYQKLKNQLLANSNIETLDSYEKVESWLIEINPDLKKEIQIEKIHYPVINDLIEEGKVSHEPRSRKLHWEL